MKRAICLMMISVVLAGCGGGGKGLFHRDSPLFDGQRFGGSVKAARSDRQSFVVTINGVSKSPEGAIAAAEYKATQHCIEYFGTSDVDWQVGPQTTPLPVSNDTLTLRGSCRDV
ncbi:hypothetical protein [Antarctobacter jejuensis]|uniref:hypothetical protein n=1 Tax=Antarctobacter jejuensis TaxID=1439938 RepID=UPI003FD101DC